MSEAAISDRVLKMETLPRRWLKTNAGRAAIAQAWVDGAKQKDIARAFGYSAPTSICEAVLRLIRDFSPEICHRRSWMLLDNRTFPAVHGEDRKDLARNAVRLYLLDRMVRRANV